MLLLNKCQKKLITLKILLVGGAYYLAANNERIKDERGKNLRARKRQSKVQMRKSRSPTARGVRRSPNLQLRAARRSPNVQPRTFRSPTARGARRSPVQSRAFGSPTARGARRSPVQSRAFGSPTARGARSSPNVQPVAFVSPVVGGVRRSPNVQSTALGDCVNQRCPGSGQRGLNWCNPDTGKCIKKGGRVWNKLLKEGVEPVRTPRSVSRQGLSPSPARRQSSAFRHRNSPRAGQRWV